ncbi:alpha/beta hydrolase [Mycobacteroides abscessus]|uniref:alpha/beta hydrolase n=1 Tax=Mycobacteroides abscessus TaxID=36809 RepID=UPI0009A5AEFD|nr:alpha/beta fold hydrolase [Mycobacteroides abscessus]SKG48220.1 alpha/beta hydrolase fold protein [Mycobacteroides abscessus subsp. massiliense]SKH53741.1 alpha/beta hydrolase fold protein [Mycobacteroides abscessus subsp. massiliense]SKH96052.1 alpha/beta hydrolase fold protein [Mycobacteroides abscessus subsp. massiliense]SKI91763.1 alpha/beta hydrolase fold protein [Mycobacteroides abscessus subsp. massiliense]SKJ46820.1 alpha/beta hydrolase fold protein [Mycobacteroides abscessus subsp.
MSDHTVNRRQLRIPVHGNEELDAWVYVPDAAGPVPVVVMAHGIGGIKAAGLAPFAQHFADKGFGVVAFDYRHWGESTGEPRQFLSVSRQLQDYRSALAWARSQDEFDGARVFAWGTSFAGMHIVELAAGERGLAGAIAQCPLVDGLAGLTKIPPARALQLIRNALADLVGSIIGLSPRYLPLSVPKAQFGVIATDDAMVGLRRLHPEDGLWPNEITARSLLDITVHRPVRRAGKARCPLLMVVAENDTMAPTGPALTVATRAPRGELYRSRGGHYDVYAGGIDHENVLRVETAFLQRHSATPPN